MKSEALDEILAQYLLAVEAGNAPSREEWLARYPDLAGDLEAFLQARERFARVAAPLRLLGFDLEAGNAETPRDEPLGHGRLDNHLGLPYAFGDYDLLEELARGGMGVVYKARQRSANRLVAVKQIRFGALASADEVRRFRNEAEMVANLDHPQIVPLYDVGEHNGHPFFSMKLIEGQSLAQQLPRYQTDPRAAARLLVQITRAVHHAHQRGVLHRDLKPSNVLIDAAGQPHVVDFGLAKRVAFAEESLPDAESTRTGAIVGTPSYMAPEQAAGKKAVITTATDVYGLGTILYSLLTGRPPFRGDTPLDTLAQVKEREPEWPSVSNPGLDRDLGTICMKCLEKSPERRYASALALGEDLERWLNGEPILARSISGPGRLWRWCRRNPVFAGLAITVALLAIMVIAGLSIATLRIQEEQAGTRAALEQAQANSIAAGANGLRAAHNTREALWALQDILCIYDEKRSLQPPTVAELKQWQTQRALRLLDYYRQNPSEEPSVRQEKVGTYVHVGRVYQVIGERDKALKAFQQAVAAYLQLLDDFPDDVHYHRPLATAYRIIAEDRYEMGQYEDANAHYTKAVEAWRKAVRDDPTCDANVQFAYLLCNWFDPQLRDPQGGLEIARKAVELGPEDPHSWLVLGFANYRLDQWDAAREALQKSLQWPETEGKWTWPHSLLFLAMTQWRSGRHAEAVQAYEQANRKMERSILARDVLDRAIRAEAAALLGISGPAGPK